jgi:hypothetical protein
MQATLVHLKIDEIWRTNWLLTGLPMLLPYFLVLWHRSFFNIIIPPQLSFAVGFIALISTLLKYDGWGVPSVIILFLNSAAVSAAAIAANNMASWLKRMLDR